ncbi:1-phosphatidylinositol-3-phosphate 5-kinase [Podila epigama]|nr:1-phosphatidylinositol-3-phosphate 5-kinase [Podila epigama]
MSSLTSFDALHEPPSEYEDPPENVLSKIFQRVKSTLSTTYTAPSSSTSSTGTPSQTTVLPQQAGSNSHGHSLSLSSSNSSSSLSHPLVNNNSSGSRYPTSSTTTLTVVSTAGAASTTLSDQQTITAPENASISASSVSTGSHSPPAPSDTGPWGGVSSDSKSTSNSLISTPTSADMLHHSSRLSTSTTGSSLNGRRAGLEDREYKEHDRLSVVRRQAHSSSAPKRVSSLFRVSTVDHSIVQDDDTASLSSLAPPVVSLSPAFGDQRTSDVTRDYLHHTIGVREASYDSDTRSIRSFSSGHQKGNSLTKVIRRLRGEGHIFCSKCASKIISGIKLGYEGYMRVCNYCLEIMQEYEEPVSGLNEYPVGSAWPTPIPPALHSGHFSQQIPMSPSITSNQDATPLDGIRKFLNAGSNLFLARSRSNTTTGDHGMDGGPAPFRRSLAIEDGSMQDSVLDPEIAPFMGDDDDDDGQDLWTSSSPHALGFMILNAPPDDDLDSDEEMFDFSHREKIPPRATRNDEIRDMFAKDRSPINRRISVSGNRPGRNLSLSLKTRGLLRTDGSESARSPMDVRPSSPFLGSNAQALLHPGRHSRAASLATSAIELNSASLQHIRRLLRQLLTRFEIDNRDGWDEVIMKLVLKVSNSIQILGGMDVMQVVKIKKIPGGTAQDTLYINGVVCTKNLAHKQMSRTIQNPRILILKFALEYQRFENHFISLEPIVNQEEEYLQHLVARIVALRPHLIIVEKTVSRLALELLQKNNVAVAYNVKPEVTEAIAHTTGADIILSFDKLVKEPRLGTCGTFEIKTFVHELIPNKRKSYMFFQDCPGNLFCSLVLRGGSLETLNRIKKVVRLMVWVSYNLKLETSLMNDQFAMTSALKESQLAAAERVDISTDADIAPLQEMLKPYKQTILSASPFVQFSPPFLLTKMIEDAEKLKKIEQSTNAIALRDIGNAKIQFAYSSSNATAPSSTKPSTGRSQDSGFVEGTYIDISNDFQAKSKAWEVFLSSNIGPSLIMPFAYQNLAFLFSNVCTSTKTICVGPVIRLIQYYTLETDVTLAHYLDQICWESNFTCTSPSCDRPLRDHQRIYAHGDAKVVVTVEPWDSLTTLKKDSIMMWGKCQICHVETPQVYISNDTKNYSFGKFLELILYQTNVTCRANICPHDINRHHVKYFGLDTQLVKIERIPIRLFDIDFPPLLVRCKPEYSARTKNQDLDIVRTQITRYWDSVMERIQNCIFDVVHPSKIEAAKQELLEMSRKVVVEKKWVLQFLQQTYLNSLPTDTLALNLVRIKLHEKAIAWDKTFGQFAREYFNPDRDFRRTTTSQLRRLFDEKEFPVVSDRLLYAGLQNDLPMSLDSHDTADETDEDIYGFTPSELPYLGSSPTLRPGLANANIEEGDVAALESAIDTASSHIAFPFMEPKVTRRLSMNLMQEFRPKLTQTHTSDSILTVTDEPQDIKAKTSSEPRHGASTIPRLPTPGTSSPSSSSSSPSRPTTRVSSRLSMVTLPSFDPMSLVVQERHRNQQQRANVIAAAGLSTSSSPPPQAPRSPALPSPFSSRGAFADRMVIPLNRTPTTEKPPPSSGSSTSSTSSGKNPFFYNKPRQRRPTEATPGAHHSQHSGFGSSTTLERSSNLSSSNNLSNSGNNNSSTTTTSLGNRRSLYLARAQGGNNAGVSPSSSSTNMTALEPNKTVIGNRSRSMTQPIPGSTSNARSRYLNAMSNSRHLRAIETKQPTIEVFSSVKEAAKEESDDEEDQQSEEEGDESYQPSRGYTFSLIQTDAMDEALGSEDPLTIEKTARFGTSVGGWLGGSGGSGAGPSGTDDSLSLDPVIMFLGDDEYPPPQNGDALLSSPSLAGGGNGIGNGGGSGSGGGGSGNGGGGTGSSGLLSTSVGSSSYKTPSVNMTVSGTLSAALAAAKLPQLSDVAEGVERGSLIKTLSNFWQDRNSPNFTPLEYPIQPFQHVFPYSQIIVREDEPSSIIALTLSSPQYVEKLKGVFRGDTFETDNTAPMSTSGTATPAEEGSVTAFDANGPSTSSTDGIYEDIRFVDDALMSSPGMHMKFPFLDGSTMLYCKIFYMEQFHALRKSSGCEYSYIQSLARCMKFDATGGKSGSSFLKTRDDRFIMKQLSKVELEAFIKFAPHYFQYMHQAIHQKRPTVLAKIFGFYRVGYKHGALGRSMNMDVLIMENLFYDRKNLQIYDLKGSRRNRFVQPSGKENEVLLDENFIEFMSESPFFIREHAKMQLSESLANDSLFLQQFNIMDYSLLVAVGDEKQELVVGIVDFIRPFTWDKKLESWVKDAVGSKEPTIVSPAQYRKRFRNAMNRHLDMVPDRWFDIDSFFSASIVHRSIGRSHHKHHFIQQQVEEEAERVQKQRQQLSIQTNENSTRGSKEHQSRQQQQHHHHHQHQHQHHNQNHQHHHTHNRQQQQEQHHHQHASRQGTDAGSNGSMAGMSRPVSMLQTNVV